MRRFVARVEERALGTAVLKGVKPEQQLVKVVNDGLIDLMGGKASGLVEGGPGRPQVLLQPVLTSGLGVFPTSCTSPTPSSMQECSCPWSESSHADV